MPSFSSISSYVQSLQPGQTIVVFNAEQPAAGSTSASASVPVSIAGSKNGAPVGLAVDLSFSAAPGAFEVDVLVADVVLVAGAISFTGFTLLNGGAITAVDANNNAHLELPNVTARFICLLIKTRTNAVNLTARITRS